MLAALRGQLWEREVRFFTAAGVAALLYALGWYTPVFRVLYEVVPGRRPVPAAGRRHVPDRRAGGDPRRLRRASPVQGPAGALGAALGGHYVSVVIAAAFEVAIGLGLWLDRLGRRPLPLAPRPLSFAGAALALARPGRASRSSPCSPPASSPRSPTADLAYNNGPNGATALPPATYDVLEPDTRNATIALLKEQGRARRHAARPHRAGRSRLPLAQRQPHARAGEHAGLQPPAPRPLQRRRPAPRTTSACRTSARSRPCFPPTAPRSPICWACASSSRACRSRPWTDP